jgi:hypothetical protein
MLQVPQALEVMNCCLGAHIGYLGYLMEVFPAELALQGRWGPIVVSPCSELPTSHTAPPPASSLEDSDLHASVNIGIRTPLKVNLLWLSRLGVCKKSISGVSVSALSYLLMYKTKRFLRITSSPSEKHCNFQLFPHPTPALAVRLPGSVRSDVLYRSSCSAENLNIRCH